MSRNSDHRIGVGRPVFALLRRPMRGVKKCIQAVQDRLSFSSVNGDKNKQW